MKTCQFCAEPDLQDEAKVCKHCGKSVVNFNDEAALKMHSADRLTSYDRLFIYLPMAYGAYKVISGDIWSGLLFIIVGGVNRYIILEKHKKKIISESTLVPVSALRPTSQPEVSVVKNNITSEELNKSKEEDLMDLHKMGLTLNSDEIEFLKSRGKKVSVKSL